MALVIWNVRYVLPADRNTNQNLRSNMQYGATREGVQKLVEVEKEPPMSDAEGLNYIANRRGVARLKNDDDTFGDGLFNAGGKADLDKEVSRMESHADSTEWRAIISFTKEDLRRSGYDDPEAFRQLLAAKMPEIGKQYGISHQNLVWNAAFHPVDKKGMDHHPHYHVYFYSTDPSEGIGGSVSVKKTEKARSILTNAIFSEDVSQIQFAGREARARLNAATQKLLENSDWMLTSGLDARLRSLGDQLPKTGKKVYAFLPHALKKTVDDMLRDIVKQPGISDAYAELVAAQHNYIEMYNDKPELIQERIYAWTKHFFHPTGKNDRATLHNRLIQMASKMAEDSPTTGPWIPMDDDAPPEVENIAPSESDIPLPVLFGEEVEEENSTQESDARRRQAHMERLANRMQKGDMDACFWLSRMIRRDNPELAEKLMNTAADNGHSGALQEVAKKQTDPQAQTALLERAAATGDPRALYNLGKAAERASLYDKAFYCYEKAANRNVQASLRLADLYQKKEWLDPEQAEHYRQTARALLRIEDVFLDESFGTMEKATLTEEDYKFARHQLGFAYQESGKISDAFMEYSEAAIKGHLDSMRSVVRIHHHAGWMQLLQEQESAEFVSVAHNLSQSLERQLLPCAEFSAEYRKARQLLRNNDPAAVELLIAEVGTKNALASIDLGRMYEEGNLVPLDETLSSSYYLQAREQMKSILSAAEKAKKPNGYLEFRLGTLILKGKGSEPNAESGIQWYEKAISHGSAMAALELAHIYERGELKQKNLALADEYYGKAISLLKKVIEKAEKKEGVEPNHDLEFRIGQLLMDGKGCEPNIKDAIYWFQRASAENVWASLRLATIYAKGEQLDLDQAKQYRLLSRTLLDEKDKNISNEEIVFARYRLGHLYQEAGQISDAIREYSKAAEKGHLDSVRALVRIQHHTGWMEQIQELESKEFVSTVQKQMQAFERQLLPCAEFSAEYWKARELMRNNDPTAVELLIAEAGTKNALAAIELGHIYEEGKLIEVNTTISQNYYKQAFHQLQAVLSVEENATDYLEFQFAKLHLSGKGCPLDIKSGIWWCQRSMNHGNALAALKLAQIYEYGQLLPVDKITAEKYYVKAVDLLQKSILESEQIDQEPNGYFEFQLGQLLMDGKGCEKNVEKAAEWFHRALKHGNEYAANRLARIYLDTEDARAAVNQIGRVHVLRYTEVADQPEFVKQTVKRLAAEMSAGIPEDLQADLKDAAEKFFLKKMYHHDVSTVVTGIYQSATLRRDEYQELAVCIHCATSHSKELTAEAQEYIKHLLPPVAAQADEPAREQMEQAVLSIAVSERIKNILENDPALRNLIVEDTADLRENIRSFGCTKYSRDLPIFLQEKLHSTAERVAMHHPEFKAANDSDPERWQRHVWNIAQQQMYAQQLTHRFARNSIATMLMVAADVGRMAAQLQEQQQQSKDPEKRKNRKERQSNRNSIEADQTREDVR